MLFSRTEVPTKYTKYVKKIFFMFPKENRKNIRQKSYL